EKKTFAQLKIEKYNQYKNYVLNNREKEIKANTPTKEEIDAQIVREKFEFDKKLALEKEKRERYRDNLLNTVVIGGVGYGTYRLGRHHHWW
ncbi:MAG: hypothetical protein Q4B33_06610, partial [Fusobacterium sp.]|nr:hypothetical protein [Fusobacterium sp.]